MTALLKKPLTWIALVVVVGCSAFLYHRFNAGNLETYTLYTHEYVRIEFPAPEELDNRYSARLSDDPGMGLFMLWPGLKRGLPQGLRFELSDACRGIPIDTCKATPNYISGTPTQEGRYSVLLEMNDSKHEVAIPILLTVKERREKGGQPESNEPITTDEPQQPIITGVPMQWPGAKSDAQPLRAQ